VEVGVVDSFNFFPDDCMKEMSDDTKHLNITCISQVNYPLTMFIASNFAYIIPFIWSFFFSEVPFKIRARGLLKLQI
jgi:hypothetical protein